eukprot:scaffold8721_cov80-Phaeocystis_antarctica.AAC.3
MLGLSAVIPPRDLQVCCVLTSLHCGRSHLSRVSGPSTLAIGVPSGSLKFCLESRLSRNGRLFTEYSKIL